MSQEAQDLRTRLKGALEECQRLREEVRQLKRQMGLGDSVAPEPGLIEGTFLPTAEDIADCDAPASKPERVTLFRSLFRGREDVYAHRIQFKRDVTWGYVPHGEHDWAA